MRARIITDKGVKSPDSDVILIINAEDQHMHITDIRIEGTRVNRGYGSLLTSEILKLARQMKIRIITGWLSHVDWGHIYRAAHFYRKFGFEVKLEERHGDRFNEEVSI